jgi:hypothetical protein
MKIELPKYPCEHHDSLEPWYNRKTEAFWMICSVCGARRPATVSEMASILAKEQKIQ